MNALFALYLIAKAVELTLFVGLPAYLIYRRRVRRT